MDQTRTTDKLDAGQEAVAAAILTLGEATAAALAEAAGIAYSTTTKKLRLLETAGRLEAFKSDDGRTLWRATTSAAPADPADTDTDADATAVPAPSTELAVEPEPTDTDPVDDADTPPPTDTEPAETEPTDSGNADTSDSGVATPENTVHSPGADEASDTDVSTDAGDSTDGDTDAAAAQADVHATDASTAEQTCSTEPVAPDVDAGADGEPVADSDDKPNTDLESAGPEADQAAQNGPDPVRSTVVDGSTPTVDDNVSAAGARRRPGTLIESIRAIMRANPDTTYRVGQLCKLIDQANEGTGAKKASPGAVKNQLDKLGGNGEIILMVEHPATFQLATTT
ncbi:MAG TPA: hypothetical protein VF755_25195 [Catenuloplanes sp.]